MNHARWVIGFSGKPCSARRETAVIVDALAIACCYEFAGLRFGERDGRESKGNEGRSLGPRQSHHIVRMLVWEGILVGSQTPKSHNGILKRV